MTTTSIVQHLQFQLLVMKAVEQLEADNKPCNQLNLIEQCRALGYPITKKQIEIIMKDLVAQGYLQTIKPRAKSYHSPDNSVVRRICRSMGKLLGATTT